MTDNKPVVVISFDVEATGTSPSSGSMNMLGITVIREDMYKTISNYPNNKSLINGESWYIDKKQWCIKEYNGREDRCMREFWSKYPDNLIYIIQNAKDPKIVARELSDYLSELSKTYEWYFMADPASFDWQWLNDFYDKFGTIDKTYIGYKARCMDSMEKALDMLGIDHDTKKQVEEFGVKMTHLADDDSEYQAYQYILLLRIIHCIRDRMISSYFQD
ncbi:MAG: hypothetical protein E6R13_01975 [Spirochaetes bacterium]|nr:MAG: hypothetical protein E6R13_01975 [Spirochaetota bacterium]